MQFEYVLVKPLITEKSSLDGERNNRYGFIVGLHSTKNQIKTAVESLYDVKVVSVRTSIKPGPARKTQKGYKKLSSIKKAFVQLKEGQKIEFFKGV